MKDLSYAEYIAEHLDNNIAYSEYLAENIEKNIKYSEYISECLDQNIDYTVYINESMHNSLELRTKKLRKNRNKKIKELFSNDIYDDFNNQCEIIKNNNSINE